MSSTLTSLVGTVLRGLRARRLLSVGSVLLTALAIGSAILGPSFQQTVTNSYAITRLDEAPARSTGITRVFAPDRATSDGGVVAASQAAVSAVEPLDDGPWLAPSPQAESVRFSALRGVVRLWSRADACADLDLEGRCPERAGEVVMLAADAEVTGARIGEPLSVQGFEPGEMEGQFPRLPFDEIVVTGTYRAPTGERAEAAWFDPTRFASIPERVDITGGYTPYSPAPLITVPETFDALDRSQWSVRVDRPLDVGPGLTATDLAVAGDDAAAVSEDPVEVPGGMLTGDTDLSDLAAVVAEVRAQQETARASISPAVLSLVLVALALLLRLLMAASELRVPELALASLRGVSARRLWALGLAEPLALLLISVPVGIGLGAAMSWGLTRWWLLPGLPVPIGWGSALAAGVVLLAAGGVAVAATSLVLRETLATQLAGVRRPAGTGVWALLTQLLLVALAVAVLASKLTVTEPGDPDATDLVLPVLLAVVAGLGATRLVAAIATWWTRGHRGGSLSGYVSTRAISRRREGTLVILPLTAAIAVGVFGAGIHDSAATWRTSVAATVAPGDTVWRSGLPITDTVDLTRRIDPDGEWATTVATVQIPGSPFTLIDSDTFADVAVWPASWSPDRSVDDVVAGVAPTGTRPELDGRRVSLTIDNRATTGGELYVELRFGTRAGRPLRRYLGPFAAGSSTVTTTLPECGGPCRLEGLSAAGAAATMTTMQGPITLSDLEVDGRAVPGAFAGAGWQENPDLGDASAVVELETSDDALRIGTDSQGSPGMAKLVTLGIPRGRLVQAGVGVSDEAIAALDGSGPPPVEPVGALEGMPFLGPAGLFADYRSYTVDRPVYDSTFETRVLVRDGAPATVVDGLTDAGLSVETRLADEERVLGQGAYALALRLYAVVAALVLLMALAGLVVSTAVQLPARRADAAALRVVGVPRRSVMWAVGREFAAVLGAAAVAGILAGSLAQWVVLRTITLGYVEDLVTPRLIAEIDPVRLVVQALIATALLGGAALVSAWLTVRGARGATLREKAR